MVTNFPFSRKTLMSKKDKRPSFSFFNVKFMLGCLEDEYFLNSSAWLRVKNNTNIYKNSYCILNVKILARFRPNGDAIATPSIYCHTIEFIVKHKKRFFGGYGKQIMKNILRDLRAILNIFTQTINANINGLLQWNACK